MISDEKLLLKFFESYFIHNNEKLQNRDLELLAFCLRMDFITIENLFKNLVDGCFMSKSKIFKTILFDYLQSKIQAENGLNSSSKYPQGLKITRQ